MNRRPGLTMAAHVSDSNEQLEAYGDSIEVRIPAVLA